jgi:hypothetical protein
LGGDNQFVAAASNGTAVCSRGGRRSAVGGHGGRRSRRSAVTAVDAHDIHDVDGVDAIGRG